MSRQLRMGIAVAGAVVAVCAIATPEAQMQVQQLRVPTISVPRTPTIGTPDASIDALAVPRPLQQSQWRLTGSRAQAMVEAARRGLNYIPGEVIVKFKAGTDAIGQTRALQASLSGRPTASNLEWRGPVAIVRDETQPDPYRLAQQLAAQPEVDYAEPNYLAKIAPLEQEFAADGSPYVAPVAPPSARPSLFTALSGARPNLTPTDTDYGTYQWNFGLINMPGAWDIQPGGRSDLIVAVVDTGITVAAQTMTFPLWTGSSFQNISMSYAVNPDLPASRLVAPHDFAFLDPTGPVFDMDAHGTHVSGTIGQATNNGLLVAGMAYNVKIMPVKVCVGYWEVMIARAQLGITGFAPSDSGGCSYADVADGIRYAADNGAKVMNISLGGAGSSTTLRDALAYAVSKGVFVAISMGNDYEVGNAPSYPARYAQDFDGVMSVASVNKSLLKSYYSSTGPHCEIAAPGGDARNGSGTTDRGLIWQSTILSSDISPFLLVPRFDRYDKQAYQGTSMASPHVTGLAALMRSQMPNATPAQIEKLIRVTAKDLGTAGKDDSFGYGLIQPKAALFGLGIR